MDVELTFNLHIDIAWIFVLNGEFCLFTSDAITDSARLH